MKPTIVVLISLLFASLSLDVHSRDIYKWKDSNGKTYYSESPPKKGKYEHIKRFANTNKQRVKVKVVDEKTKESEMCLQAQENRQMLESNSNVRMHNDQGELVSLTETQQANQLSIAKQQIRMYCSNEVL